MLKCYTLVGDAILAELLKTKPSTTKDDAYTMMNKWCGNDCLVNYHTQLIELADDEASAEIVAHTIIKRMVGAG
jgi:hypothetical protein